jgi:DNA-binding FadR family transcriptional regulator
VTPIDTKPARTGPGRNLHLALAHELGVAVVTGKYKPGDRLPREMDYASDKGAARSVYREAVRTLAAKGLVESRPKIGTRVTPRDRWNLLDPDVLAWMFEGEPSERFIRDLFALRMIVEPAAAALAAEHRTSAQVKRMRDALTDMERHPVVTPEWREADELFHRALVEAAGNEPLATLASTITAAVGWTTIFKQRGRALPRDPLPEHQRVFAAIEAADPDAARTAMAALVAQALVDTERRDDPSYQ